MTRTERRAIERRRRHSGKARRHRKWRTQVTRARARLSESMYPAEAVRVARLGNVPVWLINEEVDDVRNLD